MAIFKEYLSKANSLIVPLRNDESGYVRKLVNNTLKDIIKNYSELVVEGLKKLDLSDK